MFLESLAHFYHFITSYPMIFFSILMLIAFIYWGLTIMGLGSFEAPEVDAEGLNVLSGLIAKFGLKGVPTVVIFTLIALIGWLLCYIASYHMVLPLEPGLMANIIGTFILMVSFYFSIIFTGLIIRPLRKYFHNEAAEHSKHLLGQVLIVRTSRVDENFGEAVMQDGGAGLILKVRSSEQVFKKGDKVVPYEYVKEQNTYRVISENEFLGKS